MELMTLEYWLHRVGERVVDLLLCLIALDGHQRRFVGNAVRKGQGLSIVYVLEARVWICVSRRGNDECLTSNRALVIKVVQDPQS